MRVPSDPESLLEGVHTFHFKTCSPSLVDEQPSYIWRTEGNGKRIRSYINEFYRRIKNSFFFYRSQVCPFYFVETHNKLSAKESFLAESHGWFRDFARPKAELWLNLDVMVSPRAMCEAEGRALYNHYVVIIVEGADEVSASEDSLTSPSGGDSFRHRDCNGKKHKFTGEKAVLCFCFHIILGYLAKIPRMNLLKSKPTGGGWLRLRDQSKWLGISSSSSIVSSWEICSRN